MKTKEKFYGVSPDKIESLDTFEATVEEISLLGFSVIRGLLSDDEIRTARAKADAYHDRQVEEFGKEALESINELNLLRCPLHYDEFFLQIALKPAITAFVRHFIGDYYIINQQNCIINTPNQEHYQSSWHRDLPYQDYVISKPIALSCLICIDPFTTETGSTYMLPHSHRMERMPSVGYLKNHMVSSNAAAGDAILFNSMAYHKAGYNSSDTTRRGLNTMFSIPLLKQQINLYDQLEGKYADDPALSRILGYDSQVPKSVAEWRNKRINRTR